MASTGYEGLLLATLSNNCSSLLQSSSFSFSAVAGESAAEEDEEDEVEETDEEVVGLDVNNTAFLFIWSTQNSYTVIMITQNRVTTA